MNGNKRQMNMKKQLIYMFLVCLSAIISCEQIEEPGFDGNQVQVEKINLTLDAVIEKSSDTRAALDGSLTDERMRTVWTPSDAIGVVAWHFNMEYRETPVEEFVTNISENAEEAVFEGVVASSSKYYALYPYSSSLRNYSGKFIFELPETQNYVQDSFDAQAIPMVAKAANGEAFEFQHLCGLLALKMTGNETVKAITFIGKDENGTPMPLSGTAFVDMEYEDEPVMTFNATEVGLGNAAEVGSGYTPDPNTSITLNCETPVQLSETATPFYFVLPPATYSSFVIMVHTADGEVMVKEATNPITIARSHVKPTAALQYAETVYVDLSETGCANSYIVSESGMYSFDARTIGNGTFGLIESAEFHTKDVEINPSKVEILWQDRENVITAPALVNGQVRFYAMGSEGNTLIAVKDDAGNILWSWHIWSTDKPVEQTYVNSTGEYVMLDRNIGAIRADRGTSEEDWKESIGLHYQWGRKDPFAFEGFTKENTQLSLDEAIEMPTCFAYGNSQWTSELSKDLWSTTQKTIYDPCPVGYRVAVSEVWRGFTTTGESVDKTKNMNIASAFNYGWDFYINDDESETAWYPATSDIYYWGGYVNYNTSSSGYWSANNEGRDWSRILSFHYYSDLDCGLNPNNTSSSTYGRQVRCMKDENATSVAVNIQSASESVSDITATSAKVSATVASQGDITIERAGIVYGTSSSVSLNNGESVDADVTSGKFTVTLDNLKSLKKYYAKAFAVASDGNTYYSDKAISFITPNDGGVIDLSVGGTANCYIVYPVKGIYAFDLVKGNTLESVGEVASVDVLWETYNNNSVVAVGSVVSSATFEDGKAKFEVPEGAVSGNALIAAKDADGTILWSWHIWVADYDPVQTQQTYATGAIMMDRNLGATSVIPGTVESYGFFYQWGRKDPFVVPGYMTTAPVDAIVYEYYKASNDTIENATQHPTTVYDDADWGGVDSLWIAGNVKTVYDPCPAGWKVSDKNAWGDRVNRADNSQHGYFQIAPEYATPTAYIPLPGYSDGNDTISNNSSEGHIWLSERGYMMYFWVWNGSAWPNSNYGVDQLMGVRCMKMDDGIKPGSGDDYIVDDDYYEWE